MKNDKIIVKGARVNNLKNIDVEIPRSKLVVMTGLSGSGKSSLAFDTIYAEGQRRYMDSLSAYARQFLGNSEKPDVDLIEGLSPAISIEQKTTHNNPRSTIGTVTEIYDYLRLLYARIGHVYCPIHHHEISAMTIKQMITKLYEEVPLKSKLQLLAPVASYQKGTHKDLIAKLMSDGFVRAFIDGESMLLEDVQELDKNKKHNIEVVVDRIVLKEDSSERLYDSIEIALKLSKGVVQIERGNDEEGNPLNRLQYSENFACTICGFSIPNLEPRLFSFNSPLGACHTCKGLGVVFEADIDLIIDEPEKSINKGGIKYYRNIIHKDNLDTQKFKALCNAYKIDLDKPLNKMSKKEMNIILNGSDKPITYTLYSSSGTYNRVEYIEGVKTLIERRYATTESEGSKAWYSGFMAEAVCPECNGSRLSKEALSVEVGGKNIYEFTLMPVDEALEFVKDLANHLNKNEVEISKLVLKELNSRLTFLMNVGLEYLNLARTAGTLSGGEAQRIRLATQIGSALTGVLYVLDEPSIGLHQRDNEKLIATLRGMQQLGNTMIVVEHDEDTMKEADYIIDIGPGAGEHGGEIVAAGTYDEIVANKNSITGQYLSKEKYIPLPKTRKKGNGNFLEVRGAKENNLKNINAKFPLGAMTIVTGVSGGGKSTLVNEILYKSIANKLYKNKQKPGLHKEIKGLENIDKVIEISQDPIGRTPRSNPATYTSVFDDIRDLYALSKEAKARGYQKGRFSFNTKGGRCEACQGDGVIKIAMHFLPDVYVVCEECGGKRYNDETLQVTFKDKNIADVLAMTVDEACDFFTSIPKIKRKLDTLQEVGLGYIKLGQSATTLSGGEAQRIKLATELQKRATGKTVYILDEPTTGLHIDDVSRLIKVLQKIVDNGDTVIIIEHNLDVIKVADYIIDLGPEGGKKGGSIVAKGTPEQVIKVKESYTGQFLKPIIEDDKLNNRIE
ncbi:excinuclease ABC subunit UvrA [Mycoplasma sp. P36-A1]|uniref:excinuclease ABC subunit UvrA n=1 Tax=Mycoplasma sp. P36-A1 TaxID=3252900 RepID=UPI003C2CDE65